MRGLNTILIFYGEIYVFSEFNKLGLQFYIKVCLKFNFAIITISKDCFQCSKVNGIDSPPSRDIDKWTMDLWSRSKSTLETKFHKNQKVVCATCSKFVYKFNSSSIKALAKPRGQWPNNPPSPSPLLRCKNNLILLLKICNFTTYPMCFRQNSLSTFLHAIIFIWKTD